MCPGLFYFQIYLLDKLTWAVFSCQTIPQGTFIINWETFHVMLDLGLLDNPVSLFKIRELENSYIIILIHRGSDR